MHKIRVKGMLCRHCGIRVEKAIKSIKGVNSVNINLEDGTVEISGDFELNEIKDIIFNEGYEVV